MRLMIGIPIVDSVPGEAFQSLCQAVVECAHVLPKGTEIVLEVALNTLPHSRARDYIVQKAKQLECDLLYFIDDDMIIPGDAFGQLYQSLVDSGAQVVSGHYYRRGYPYTCVWSVRRPDGEMNQADVKSGVHRIQFSGLGCALIDLNWCLKKMEQPWFSMFQDGIAINVTDDVCFFAKLEEAGGVLLGHADVRCGHLGARTVIYDQNVDHLRKLDIEVQQVLQNKKLEMEQADGNRS